jgi:hypothetical protein
MKVKQLHLTVAIPKEIQLTMRSHHFWGLREEMILERKLWF